MIIKTYIGIVLIITCANGFDSEKFLRDYCRKESYDLKCSNVKLSENDQNEIQNNKFVISYEGRIKFYNSSSNIIVNGALFEKFPNAYRFGFDKCTIDLTKDTKRSVSDHEHLDYLTIHESTVKTGYGTENKGFKTLKKLDYIYFTRSKFTNGLKYGVLQQTPNITLVWIEGIDTTDFELKDILKDLAELKYIYINDMKNLKLNADIFQNKPKLTLLGLNNCGLEHVPSVFFPPNLEHLQFSGNKIRFITAPMFSKFKNLKYLSLNENAIDNISENAFDNLGKLEDLWLMNNRISSLTRSHLKGLKNLKLLDISNNQIGKLDSKTFDDLEYLEYLKY